MAEGFVSALLEGISEGFRAAREAYTRRRKEQAASLIPEADRLAERIEQLGDCVPAPSGDARPAGEDSPTRRP